jgi:hypothetical protein
MVLLTILLLKICAEFISDASLFTGFGDPTIRSVPLSHLFGMLAGVLAGFVPKHTLKFTGLKKQRIQDTEDDMKPAGDGRTGM